MSKTYPNNLLKQGHDAIIGQINNCLKFGYNAATGTKCPNKFDKQKWLFDKNAKWFIHYFLLNAETIAACYLAGLFLQNYLAIIIGGAVVGTLIQGNSDCIVQQVITDKPLLAATTGALNGMMCCAATMGAAAALTLCLPESAAMTIAYIGISLLMAVIMCPIERMAVNCFGTAEMVKKLNDAQNPEPCCK